MTDIDDDGTDEAFKVGLQEYMNELQPIANANIFTVPEGTQFDGAIVGLFPPADVAAQIAAMSGVQMTADALHVTLAYLGKVDSLTDAQLANAIVAAQEIARNWGKLAGNINGVGRFNASESSDGKDVIYAVVDVPGLERLREMVVQMLDYRGVPVSRSHGYTPHMTLSEIEPGAESPIAIMPTIPLEFGAISVSVATKQVDFSLMGSSYKSDNDDDHGMSHNAACGCNNVQLATNATAGTVKEVTRKGKRYLVAPTVALKAGVLNGEFVPADEVAKYANAWNGRPVPIGHPKQDGQAVSANNMDMWDETPAMFWNAHADGDALKGEIWLDIEKASGMGGQATQLLQRLRNNEAIDVSTGYFRDLTETPGTHDGKAYTGIARNLRPDHIAILMNETGACSWADGCGVPRINEAKATESASQSFISALVRNVLNSLGGKKVDRNTIIEGLVANAQCECTKPQLEALDDATLTAFAKSFTKATQPVVNEDAPAVEPAPVEVIKEVVPAELAQLAKVVEQFGGIEKLTAALSGVVTNADKERADLVAGLVANERNTLSEAELQAMPVETLRKLASAFAPRVYVGGGALVTTNATAEEPRYTTMAMPPVFPKKEAK